MKRGILLMFTVFTFCWHQEGHAAVMYENSAKRQESIRHIDAEHFWVVKSLDPNGISLIDEDMFRLTNQFWGEVKIVWTPPKSNSRILADDSCYYALNIFRWRVKDQTAVPIIKKSEVREIWENFFVLNSGKVFKLTDIKSETPILSEITDLPEEFDVIAANSQGLLLRTKNGFILYTITDKGGVERVREIDLDPLTAVYVRYLNCSSFEYSLDFLYDNNRFYRIEELKYVTELTDNFKEFNKHDGFLDLKYRCGGHENEIIAFEEQEPDKRFWAYLIDGFEYGDKILYFVALEGKYLPKLELFEHNNLYFRSTEDIFRYQFAYHACVENISGKNKLNKALQRLATLYAVDISRVKIFPKLTMFRGLFSDDKSVYRLVCDEPMSMRKNRLTKIDRLYGSERDIHYGYWYLAKKRFEKVRSLSPSALYDYFPSDRSFCNPNPPFYDDNGVIKLFDESKGKILRKIAHKSEIKYLYLASLFDDKMLVEGRVIRSQMDIGSAELVESYVDIINPIDNYDGKPIKVEYRHYFRDKNGIYLYKTGAKELELMTRFDEPFATAEYEGKTYYPYQFSVLIESLSFSPDYNYYTDRQYATFFDWNRTIHQ